MASHSGTLAWRVPWAEEPGGLQSVGSRESDTTEHTYSSVCVFTSSSQFIPPLPPTFPL